MTRIPRLAVVCLMICLALSIVLRGQTTADERESINSFVQSFYDWYVPKALSDSSVPTPKLALKQRSSVFGPHLAAALREDYAAQPAYPGEIVGLDFDPFLNTQDPCEHYEVGTISHRGHTYSVEVHAICAGKKSTVPNVVAELLLGRTGWEFINFRYPNLVKQYPSSANLLSVLKILREERSKPQK
jgi:hypothetical protein